MSKKIVRKTISMDPETYRSFEEQAKKEYRNFTNFAVVSMKSRIETSKK